MLRSIAFGTIGTYYLAYLAGILIGWVFFVGSEKHIYDCTNQRINLKTVFLSSMAYFIVVIICIQGANYFHYIFDNIPARLWDRLTWKDILFTDLLGTIKVLYGAIFFYPVGIFIVSQTIMKQEFFDYLNRKSFILFFIVAFARLGCFANGCCYGIRSDLFGISFPMGSAASIEHMRRGLTHGFVPPPSLPVIPTQAVSAAVLFGLTFFCWKSYREGQRRLLFFKYLLYYAIFRFLIEFLRDDMDRAYWVGISASQWISLFIFSSAALWYAALKLKKAD